MPNFLNYGAFVHGRGHFDNRADEEHLQEKEEKQPKKKHISIERSSLQS